MVEPGTRPELGRLHEYSKPKVQEPVVQKLTDISSGALTELVGYLGGQFTPQIVASSVAGGSKSTSGVQASAPGAVSSDQWAHNFGATPTAVSVDRANNDAMGAPAYWVEFDDEKIVMHFAAALSAFGNYEWSWIAVS